MFLIFDTETTGFPKDWNAPITDLDNWPRVVQLAWQIHDENGELVEVQDHIIYPDGFDIPFNATTVALSGFKGGKIAQIATINVHAPVMDMEVTEDVHMVIFNIVKKQMMARLMGENPSMGSTYDQRIG